MILYNLKYYVKASAIPLEVRITLVQLFFFLVAVHIWHCSVSAFVPATVPHHLSAPSPDLITDEQRG